MKKTYLFLVAVLGLAVTVLIMKVGGAGVGLNNYFSVITISLLAVLSIPLLISAGLLGDFFKAFQYVLKDDCNVRLHELKRSMEAILFMQKTMLYGPAFIASFQIITMLYNLNDPASIGPPTARAFMAILYGTAVNLLLIPVRSGLNIKMIEIMEGDNEEG